MSGAIPTSRAPASISITSFSPTFISTAHSLKTQRRMRGGQRWKLHCGYGTMERADYLDLWGFINAQRGQYGTFTITVSAVPFTVRLLGDDSPMDLQVPTQGTLAFDALEDY